MASRRADTPAATQRRRRPTATSEEARERQLVSAAIDLAEKQIQSGEASAQVITHYLKLGSSREKKEQARLELENQKIRAQIEGMASATRVEELYKDAINAMRAYGGQVPQQEPESHLD